MAYHTATDKLVHLRCLLLIDPPEFEVLRASSASVMRFFRVVDKGFAQDKVVHRLIIYRSLFKLIVDCRVASRFVFMSLM
jgi:hypothetical protein